MELGYVCIFGIFVFRLQNRWLFRPQLLAFFWSTWLPILIEDILHFLINKWCALAILRVETEAFYRKLEDALE